MLTGLHRHPLGGCAKESICDAPADAEERRFRPEYMALEFKLEKFEGPLDLLLHLIEKNKVDIYDIPIAQITDQYMDYVRKMDGEDPDVMSEFLVMAATLLDIKCRMLLPRQTNEDGEEEDPRDELVQRLLAYKLCRRMSEELRVMSDGAQCSVYRGERLPEEVKRYTPPVDYAQLVGDTTTRQLSVIYRETLRRKRFRVDPVRSRFGRIEKEKVSLSGKALYIKAYLNLHRDTDFRSLLETADSREEMVASFLVILELMHAGSIEVRQDAPFGEIAIHVLRDIPAGSEWMEDFS